MSEKPTLSQKYDNTQRTLQSVVETLTRVDERLGIFVDNLNALENTVTVNKNKTDELATKIAVIEAKNGTEVKESVKELKASLRELDERVDELGVSIQELHTASKRHENIWLHIGTMFMKIFVPIVVAVVAAWLMYHWGIKAP